MEKSDAHGSLAFLFCFSLVLSSLRQITHILRVNDESLIIQVTDASSSERGFVDPMNPESVCS